MQHTTNYNLNKFDATDLLEDTSRLGLNSNFDTIDAALKDASENGGIAVQDTQPTNDVLAWIDSDQLGADFCFVGDTAPATDGSVAVWVDTSEDEIPIQAGAEGVSYDNTDSGLTADNVQGAIDEVVIFPTTDETVVGTWIDGKPIYRKRFTGTTAATGYVTAITSDGSIDILVASYGKFRTTQIGHYANVNNYSGLYVSQNNNLQLYYPDIAANHNIAYDFVVDYTKTTG